MGVPRTQIGFQPAGNSYPSLLSCETLATWSQQQLRAPQSEGLKLISTICYTLGFGGEKSYRIVHCEKQALIERCVMQ